MAYSSIEQGRLLGHPVLRSVAARHQVVPSRAALARVLRRDDICAIPRASKPPHVRENRAALDVRLLTELDRAFPPPMRKQPLAAHQVAESWIQIALNA
jgi:diketogulonate reductase-like aldo/keto reductase